MIERQSQPSEPDGAALHHSGEEIQMEKIEARTSITVVRDASGREIGYRAVAHPIGDGSMAMSCLPMGPICATRDEAAQHRDAHMIPARVEGGYSVPAIEILPVYY